MYTQKKKVKRQDKAEALENFKRNKYRGWYFYKVILNSGKCYRDYKYDRAYELYERDGTKLYAYTKDLYPTTVLLAWK